MYCCSLVLSTLYKKQKHLSRESIKSHCASADDACSWNPLLAVGRILQTAIYPFIGFIEHSKQQTANSKPLILQMKAAQTDHQTAPLPLTWCQNTASNALSRSLFGELRAQTFPRRWKVEEKPWDWCDDLLLMIHNGGKTFISLGCWA